MSENTGMFWTKISNFSIHARKLQKMKQIKIASSAKDCKRLLKEKLPTSEGKFLASKIFIFWAYRLPFLSF